MGKYIRVGFLPARQRWYARQSGGYYFDEESLDVLMREIRRTGMPIQIDDMLSAKEVLVVSGAAVMLGVQVVNKDGVLIKPSPVVEGKVRYITSTELGRLIPDGWMIEHQLNTYAACFGEQLSFPARKSLALAIADIRSYLAQAIVMNSSDLAQSIAAEPKLEQVVMDLGLASSDRRASAAVDEVHRA